MRRTGVLLAKSPETAWGGPWLRRVRPDHLAAVGAGCPQRNSALPPHRDCDEGQHRRLWRSHPRRRGGRPEAAGSPV